MPELDAFYCLCKLTRNHLPTYVKADISGAYRGLELFDKILTFADSELATYLRMKNCKPENYAMKAVLGLNGNSPPLSEQIHLWDVSLCFGVHVQLIFSVSRVVLMKNTLLDVWSPGTFLATTWPPLPARKVILLGMSILYALPEDLYREIVQHTRVIKLPQNKMRMRIDFNGFNKVMEKKVINQW
eukprot:TRINITY_DN3616_c0_g2_i4.p1 TRINITY_DN3616_c0_g2~~TRINITY_DN3616_c0_g2_i4.p1  ORF type:complete len:186 (-),score=35.71 TRINITY_DN3616_c0_g2_i4:273-830(-)